MGLGNTYKILLADGDSQLLRNVNELLTAEKFEVKTATNGREAIDIALNFIPDIILMDIVMPVMDGIEACIEMRARESLKNKLIVFYTARNEDYSQVAGFNAGADDYIIKPARPKILLTRLLSMLRRLKGQGETKKTVTDSLIKIDRERYLVLKGSEELYLPRKEFELLAMLHASPHKVFTRREISNYVWGQEMVAKNRTIDVHIRKLREKLGDHHIKTVKGIGYSFDT